MMRGAFARFLPVVIACLAGVGAGSNLLVATVAAESSGDWQITAKVDEAAKTKVLNVKVEARKTAHDGLFLPPDALLQLICLKNKPLIHVMFAFQIGSRLIPKFAIALTKSRCSRSRPRILRGLKIFVIEKKTEVKQFLDGLATANALYIQISSLDKAVRALSFAWPAHNGDRRAHRLLQARRQEDVRALRSTCPLCHRKIAIGVLNGRAWGPASTSPQRFC